MRLNPIKSVYKRLRQIGLIRPYVRSVALPDWWDDALAQNPAGYAQCLMFLSRHLGIDLKTLQNPESPLHLRDFGICKYKKREGTSDDELVLSRVIATRAAQIAAAAMANQYGPIPGASEIRQIILTGARWVGFKGLLNYCWSIGIPVLHVNYFPAGAKRPDGFAFRNQGRPVIILCRNEKQPSCLLFILAHELGHLACEHVPENGALLDDCVKKNQPDREERAANRFALELLAGHPVTIGPLPNTDELPEPANAHECQNELALSEIEFLGARLAECLNWESLPGDSREFLLRVTSGKSAEDEGTFA